MINIVVTKPVEWTQQCNGQDTKKQKPTKMPDTCFDNQTEIYEAAVNSVTYGTEKATPTEDDEGVKSVFLVKGEQVRV